MPYNQKIVQRCVWGFLLFHLIAWTLLPTLLRPVVSHDAIEAFNWSRHLLWGYDKNPYLIGWVAHLGLMLDGGYQAWGYYFIQQLCVVTGFYFVWRVGLIIFDDPWLAALSCFLLSVGPYFNFDVPINNDNFMLMLTWPLLFFVCYQAVMVNKRYWLLAGLVAGLAIMSKYSSIVFLPFIFLFLILDRRGRDSIRSVWLYLGLAITCIIILPNIIWLSQHDWISVRYYLARTVSHASFFAILQVTLNQYFELLAPFIAGVLIVALALIPIKLRWPPQRAKLLLIGFFLPWALLMAYYLVMGENAHWEWFDPFTIFIGTFILCFIQSHVGKSRYWLAAGIFAFAMCVFVIGYSVAYLRSTPGHDNTFYPVKRINSYIEQQWLQHFHTPLKYIAGSRYAAGYVSFYSTLHPQVYVEWHSMYSPWIDLKQLHQDGTVFINNGYWGTEVLNSLGNNGANFPFPAFVLKRYPHLIILPAKKFRLLRGTKTQTVTVVIGLLPPA